MCDEVCRQDVESLPLPKNWHNLVRTAILNVVGIVRVAMLAGRETLINNGAVKEARIHQLESEVAMLHEQLRINAARMQRIDPHRRPQYLPVERMAILELRAMRGWSNAETARRFFVTDDTIRAWLRRADDDSLVQTRMPVNRFPEFTQNPWEGILICVLVQRNLRERRFRRNTLLDLMLSCSLRPKTKTVREHDVCQEITAQSAAAEILEQASLLGDAARHFTDPVSHRLHA